MHRGYVKIWRKIEDSGLMQMHGTLALFLHLVFNASHKPKRVGMIDLERGQLISGRHRLSEAVGLSERSVRTCLEKLQELGILTSKPTNHFTIYTIVNYGQYQDIIEQDDQQIDQQPTSHRPTTDQPPTNHRPLYKEGKNDKNEIIKEVLKYTPPIKGELLDDWMIVRKAKKAGALTETAFKGLQREARKANLTDEQAVEVCCHRSWISFTADWYLKNPPVKNTQDAQLDVANQIMNGGRNGNDRSIIDVTPGDASESYGEGFPKTIALLR